MHFHSSPQTRASQYTNPERPRRAIFSALIVAAALMQIGCEAKQSAAEPDADAQAIVVGAGLAGLSAAVEMARAGVEVLVIDMNSVAGGHTMLAGGVAIVATPLQERLGIEDSAELAYNDWMQWTGDGDAEWTRYYATQSREMIYDWVTAMGVEFVRVAPGHGNSVPRFHFTAGRAMHLVLPIYRTALSMSNVSFKWNLRAEKLIVEEQRVTGVVARDLRSGEIQTLRAANIVLATGGFESDRERVLDNWMPGLPLPDRLLTGAAISATGTGHNMATEAGAALANIDRHYIYINGLVDPRDAEQTHALTAGNENALWVNARGERFTNEAGFDKDILVDLLQQDPASYWMIFDDKARDSFSMRGAAWLNNEMENHPILDNPQAAKQAPSLGELAAMTGLPADALLQSVRRYNDLVDAGDDTDFRRFSAGGSVPPKVDQAPFYAVQMFPMTRKNMGGVAIDRQARVVGDNGEVLPGLYAVGELNGSLGVNGMHGLDGMFLGPAIISGRLAGQSIAAATGPRQFTRAGTAELQSPHSDLPQTSVPADGLRAILDVARDGYWHFQVSHELVLERGYQCGRCHSAQLPFSLPADRASRLAQTELCINCH
jgi:flavocytochrome c